MEAANAGYAYENGVLCCEGLSLESIAAATGTPVYVYSMGRMLERYRRLRSAFAGVDAQIRYAVKANSNGAILRSLMQEGCGFDLVSGGELLRVLRVGADPEKLVFAGVGKEEWELRAALEQDIGLFNVESEFELAMIRELATSMGRRARIAIRLNPDVDAKTHEYISTGKKENKFGVSFDVADRMVRMIQSEPSLELRAYHVHLGSLLLEPAPYFDALERVLEWIDSDSVRNDGVCAYDMGGGFGIRDLFSEPLSVEEVAKGMAERLDGRGWSLYLEPGRYIVGNAGVLVTRVLQRKEGSERDFLIVDASMSELIRPALYGAEHEVLPIREGGKVRERLADVVGPICESADFLAKDRELPELHTGDLLAIGSAGAYGFSMASHYNSRPLPGEVLVEDGGARWIRRREAIEALWKDEVDEGLDL